jgi:hypothetical protein
MSKPSQTASAATLTITVASALAAMLLAACSNGSASGSGSNSGFDAAAHRTHPPRKLPFEPQKLRAPCEWLTAAEVEKVVGPLAGPPRVVRNAENVREDAEGAACAYPYPGRMGQTVAVSIQVDPTSAQANEQASNMFGGMAARELNPGASPNEPAEAKRAEGWDYVGGMPGVRVWRTGHMAIAIGGGANFLISKDKMNELAALVRDRIPDVPMADPRAEPGADGPLQDPCNLLTRAEVEPVLGKLQVAPFQSGESTPLADPEGSSCTFYTSGHHALVLTPTRSEGKGMFEVMRGGTHVVRSTVGGGADAADALDGPWDDAFEGPTGELYFLKGDAVLEVRFRSSSTDIDGAAKLARLAITRL